MGLIAGLIAQGLALGATSKGVDYMLEEEEDCEEEEE